MSEVDEPVEAEVAEAEVAVEVEAVEAEIVEEATEEERKAPKVVSYKFKRSKGYHRTVGHSQRHTRVKIGEIQL